MPEPSVNRRVSPPKPDKKLYNLSKKEIKEFIKQERRHDELNRINEVRKQKKIWWMTIIFCAALNIALISIALFGAYYG